MTTTEPDGRFYLALECENCGEDVRKLCMTTDIVNGVPVIPADMAAQDTFECECGAITYTGDMDTEVNTDACEDDEDEEAV